MVFIIVRMYISENIFFHPFGLTYRLFNFYRIQRDWRDGSNHKLIIPSTVYKWSVPFSSMDLKFLKGKEMTRPTQDF